MKVQSVLDLYGPSARDCVLLQGIIALLTGMILDGGMCLQWALIAAAAHWGAVIVIIARRPVTPTKWDLVFIRVGYLLMLVLTPFITGIVWHIRGVL